ncbi:MAG: HYExAFE family protein [Planctomycetes bacterium]|nr:HYExAFE family protein [Planctomycetota bacterium]
MAGRDDHYESAFENYLRCKDWPYIVVDDAKKKAFAGANLKNFDFLVYSAGGPNLLVDVKGRKFPDLAITGKRRTGRVWENWITREDVEGLTQWELVFGPDFQAVLVFAYWLQGPPEKTPFNDVHFFRGRHYAFAAVTLAEYKSAAKPRSAKWQTLTMPAGQFRDIAIDIGELL